jgi:hypothetical protein
MMTFFQVKRAGDGVPLTFTEQKKQVFICGHWQGWCLLTSPENGNILLVLLTGFQPEI